MRQRFTARYAAVTSTLALVVALSGTAYAVNTVRSRDIVDGEVRSADIGTGQVTSLDIQNRGVAGGDVGLNQVTGGHIAPGTVTTGDIHAGSIGSAPRLFAKVNGDGTLVAYQGATANTHDADGQYTITFARDVSTCVALATTRGYIRWITAYEDGNEVHVAAWDDAIGAFTDTPFDLMVLC